MAQAAPGASCMGIVDMEELSAEERKRLMERASGWAPEFAERRALELAFSSVFVS